MNKIFFTLLCFFNLTILVIPKVYAQPFQLEFVEYQNNNFQQFRDLVVRDVTSDYNTRNPGPTGTLFHLGVDINPHEQNNDYVLLAPFNGTIVDIVGSTNTNIKKIIFQDTPGDVMLSALHIFENANHSQNLYNGFLYQQISRNNVINNVIIDRVNHRAYSAAAGIQFTIGSTQYVTINTFQVGWPLAPLGTSGGYAYHLHLSQLESGTNDRSFTESIDPFHDVNVSDQNMIVPVNSVIRNRMPSPAIVLNNNLNCEHFAAAPNSLGCIFFIFIKKTKSPILLKGLKHSYQKVELNR